MLHILLAALTLSAPEWRSYEVYDPSIERRFVVDPAAQELKYNHVSSIAWFRDRWICVWNGNQIAAEGKPGQLDYMSTSADGLHWTPPVPAFADPAQSHNPIPCPKGYQWQPNLVLLDGELWAFWDQNSKDEYVGCWFSRLDAPDGKWRNRRLLWNVDVTAEEGSPKATVDGKAFRPFPTQNACVLRSGRVLQPVTLMGPRAADAPDGLDGWWINEKRSSVIYSDDHGATWRVSPGAGLPGRSWAQWEPTVWEEPDGSVMMFARLNDPRSVDEGGPSTTECLLWSRSTDGGATWSPHGPVALETVVSRPHVLPAGGDRFLMVHNDCHAGRFAGDRMNLALFSTRGPGLDFVAGPGFTGHEQIVAYPQMWFHEDALYISYTQGTALRGIKVARITPLPQPGHYYLFPRTNRRWTGPPEQANGALRFDGQEYLETRGPVDVGDGPFALAATLRVTERGVLLDSRGRGGGFIWGLAADEKLGSVVPFIHMGSAEGNIRSSLTPPLGEWAYCGLTLDRKAGKVTFAVDGKSEVVSIAPTKRPLPGEETGYVGYKRFEASGLTGLVGEMRGLAAFKGALSAENHGSLAAALSRGPAEPPVLAGVTRTLWLTGAAPLAEQPFTWNKSRPIARLVTPEAGPAMLEITGDASAGVDLDQNDRQTGNSVEFTCRARLAEGPEAVICTVGDGNQPVRVLVREGKALLASPKATLELGQVVGEWFTLLLRSGRGATSAVVNGGEELTLPHSPQATWLYLGDGYPSDGADPTRRVLVEVSSVQSRVLRAPSP